MSRQANIFLFASLLFVVVFSTIIVGLVDANIVISPKVLKSFIDRHNIFKQSFTHHFKNNGQKLEDGNWRKPKHQEQQMTEKHVVSSAPSVKHHEANHHQLHQHQHHQQQQQHPRLRDSNTVGAWLGINAAFFQVVNPLINDLLKYELTNFTYKEYNTSELGIHIYLNDVVVTNFNCPGNCVSIALGDNFLSLGLSSFSMNLKLAYEAKALFLHSSGTCTPVVDDMNLTAQISFAPPVKNRPQIKVSNIHLGVNTLHLNCDGFAGHIANALTDVFKFFLSDLMDDILNLVVTHEINEYLQNMTLAFNIDDYAMVNFDPVPSVSSITNADLSIGVQGVITPISNPNIQFPFPAPTNLKSQCFGGGMVNVGLSLFSFQTALYTFFIGGKLKVVLPDVASAKNVALFIPGFAKTLGPSASLNLSISAVNYGVIQFVPSHNQLSLSITLNMSLLGAQNTQYDMQVFADAAIDVSASGGAMAVLNIQIPTLALNNPQVLYTNVGGELSGPLVISFMNSIAQGLILKPINKCLANHGLPLPSVKGFEAQDMKIIVNSDSLCVASNVAPVTCGEY